MGARKKILLVGNDLKLCGYIKELLEENKYKISSANSGKEGLSLVLKEKPDLIICDDQLVNIDAYQFFELCRSTKIAKHTPFVFLADNLPDEKFMKDFGISQNDFVIKPLKINKLLDTVKEKLKTHKVVLSKESAQVYGNKEFTINDYMFLELGNNLSSIKLEDIVCLLAKGNYTIIYTIKGKKYTVRRLLKDITDILPKESFFRIHRSTCINLKYIMNIEKWSSGTFRVHLYNFDSPLSISRRYSKNIRDKTIN